MATPLRERESPSMGGYRGALGPDGHQTEDPSRILRVRADDLTQMQLRCVEEAIASAEEATWARMADRFRTAQSRPSDFGPGHPRFRGRRTVPEQQERDAELAGMALACDRKSRLLRERNGGATWLDG